MKLVRLGVPGAERTGVMVSDDHYVDVSDELADYTETLYTAGGVDRVRKLAALRAQRGDIKTIADQPLRPPIPRPHQILCVGLNYIEHAHESGQEVPTEPVIFTKAPNSICGAGDPIVRPRGAVKLDYEAELGVVIGSRSRYLPDDQSAAAAIAGFTVVNDVSERGFQLDRGGQWVKGKSCESFNPCGPFLVTADEVADCQDLDIWLTVNGEKRQCSSTRHMVFSVVTIIRYLSQFMVLEPGDLINTGTPPGVALGRGDDAYLQDGDVVELGITGLGVQRSVVVDSKE